MRRWGMHVKNVLTREPVCHAKLEELQEGRRVDGRVWRGGGVHVELRRETGGEGVAAIAEECYIAGQSVGLSHRAEESETEIEAAGVIMVMSREGS